MSDEVTEQSVEDKILERLGGLPAAEGTAEAAQTTQEIDDAFAELDWEGQTLKVPKGLKEAVMRTDDYTRKTQELAEQRRTVEQIRELAQAKQLDSAFLESVVAEQREISVIDAYLEQMKRADWSQMSAEQMMRTRLELDGIRERRTDLANAIGEKKTRFTAEVTAKMAELRGKSRELASKSIQGFTEDTEKSMRDYAKTEGLTEAEIDNVLLDPRSFKVVWKAMQFDKVKAGTSKVTPALERTLRPGVAGERMPQETAQKLNFNKAMKAAGNNSAAKAQVIEQRLTGIFAKR